MSPEELRMNSLQNLVSLALTCAVEGRSGREFERDCTRWSLAKVNMGSSDHSRHFFRQCLYVSSLVLSHMDSLEWDLPLAGIGTASDFCLVLDPVSLGHGWAARHGTVLVMNLVLVSSITCRAYSPFFAGPTMPLGGHSGANISAQALETLSQHPSNFNANALKARLALVGSDGGLAQGQTEGYVFCCAFPIFVRLQLFHGFRLNNGST